MLNQELAEKDRKLGRQMNRRVFPPKKGRDPVEGEDEDEEEDGQRDQREQELMMQRYQIAEERAELKKLLYFTFMAPAEKDLDVEQRIEEGK